MSRCNGFTLVELLITVAVLAILTTVVIPGFQSTLERNRLTTSANDLVASMLVARNEAVKRERRVSVLPDSNWSQGWLVKENDAADTDHADDLIVHRPSDSSQLAITGNGNLAESITYGPSGRITGISGGLNEANDYFRLALSDRARCIIFTKSGRPSVVEKEGCPDE